MSEARRAEVPVEVRYFETDAMGIVHHANYLVWFELARTHLCALGGTPYAEVERIGYRLVNSHAQVRYHRPARYGDTCTVRCWIERLRGRAVRFAYEVLRDGDVLATGSTEHVWIDGDTGKPCRIPEELLPGFRKLAGEPADADG